MSSMIYLKNVRKENNIIRAEYFPEDSPKGASAMIDIDNPSNCVVEATRYENETKGHIAHAKWALEDMVEEKREIKDCMVMWY